MHGDDTLFIGEDFDIKYTGLKWPIGLPYVAAITSSKIDFFSFHVSSGSFQFLIIKEIFKKMYPQN